MLAPLADPENTHSGMALELIADQKPYPASADPKRFTEIVEPSITRRRAAGATSVALGALVIGLVVAAKVAA